jgi:hypothetical protein
MGRAGRGRGGRRRLRGWFKWLFFLAIPFGLLFTETYFHTRRLANDYEINAIREELTRLEASIAVYEAERAKFDNLEFWEARAGEMHFVQPEPDQIESIEGPARRSESSVEARSGTP